MGNFIFEKLKWLNKKPGCNVLEDKIIIKTIPDTDFWRGTYYGLTYDNAPLVYFEEEKKTWTLLCKVAFSSKIYFDQCGVAIYQDSDNWMKSGIEFQANGFQQLFSVVTNRGFSDWAMVNYDKSTQEMYYRLSRRNEDFLLEYSENGQNFEMMRMFHLDNANEAVKAGFFASSPGNSTFEATFTSIQLIECVWDAHNSERF
ncbi:DUF1349 domain-containing protein [Enterococcus rivorum]|uniref:DUF1349 domain-containing protein n=1 Tax=Enterococcus rivorum TaxID=762845 RepID=A0A1E5KWB6_9ENTE|nr:DUF1349 domain-containing protein [Enterococcus rivorum]MBP2100486.1 regulation of enolase protein 1 (concanavalin A-like superfamily) [Enterococcus rivorum]OEH82155.1 hypothetical protein BCR26_14245 [Enterococcus rivorum]